MKQVYLIGAAHIDPVWLWNKSEGLSEILSTFRSALDRMEEFPNYVFTSACAGYYQWVEQIDPGMFQQIQRRVKEGRWSVVGGMWVQPDCNIPCGESFARHLLYSQRYFQEKFGQTATVGYNVDSFGHNGMLPQLLQKAGITNYVFMRPSDTEKPNLPQNLFWWQSPDGSRVLTHRITYVYNDNWGPPPGTEACSAKVEALRRRALEDGHPYLDFYGVGNHGGGPHHPGVAGAYPGVPKSGGCLFFRHADLFCRFVTKRHNRRAHHGKGRFAAPRQRLLQRQRSGKNGQPQSGASPHQSGKIRSAVSFAAGHPHPQQRNSRRVGKGAV